MSTLKIREGNIMIINHNLAANNAIRNMNINSNNASKSMQKLSSGLAINSASDNAAGLAISEKMRGQIRGLDQASANAQDGISLIQTAEGALNETTSMLQRMRELVVQANNGTNTDDDKAQIQKEVAQLSTEITDTANRTEFNTQKLITGSLGNKADYASGAGASAKTAGISIDASGAATGASFTVAGSGNTITLTNNNGLEVQSVNIGAASFTKGLVVDFNKLGVKLTATSSTVAAIGTMNGLLTTSGTNCTIQIGANKSQTLDISFDDMRSSALGTDNTTNNIASVDVTSTTQSFNVRLQIVDDAIRQVSTQRAQMGAYQNRLEHTINNLGTSSENLTSAESRIRDVDMAKEISTYSKNNILSQAAQAMLAQANQQPQQVLQLLR
jgi:flagellin